MKKFIFTLGTLFLFLVSFSQKEKPSNTIFQHLPNTFYEAPTIANQVLPKGTFYALDSMAQFNVNADTFVLSQVLKLKDNANNGFPTYFLLYDKNLDTVNQFYDITYFDSFSLEYFYSSPEYYFQIIPVKTFKADLYDDHNWVFVRSYNLSYFDYYGYYLEYMETYNYDTASNSYTSGYKFEVDYDNNHFLEKGTSYNYDPSIDYWEYNSMINYTTDSLGRIISYETQDYNTSTSTWEYDEKKMFHYYKNALLDTMIRQTWDATNNEWENQEKETYEYDSNDYLVKYVYYTWLDDPNNTWLANKQVLYQYDENGNLIEETHQYYDLLNGWINDYRYLYTYNQDNLETETILQDWNETTNDWKNSSREYYEYDANGNNTLYLYQVWDNNANEFVNQYRSLYTYENDLLVQYVLQMWNSSDNAWENDSKTEQAFTEEGLKTSSIGYNWNGTDWDYNNKNEYYWKTVTTDVEETNEISKYIYPNPATDFVYIPFDNAKVEIYSTDGKLVKTIKTQNSKINISDLTQGIYIVKMDNGKKVITDKILKQ